MRKVLLISVLLLTACESKMVLDNPSSSAPMRTESMDMAESNIRVQKTSASPNSQNNQNPTSQSFLAYRYNYGFQLPAKSVAATSKSHADMCLEAGPSKCQVLNSSTSSHNETNVSANLSLRAEPEWLENFKADLQSSVESAKGKMTNSSVSAEDLTRQILDTDARLKAQTTLRDRLQSLLATRNAELKDLLALERELARVQGQIESATSTLNVLRKRVSMSVVDINYQSQSVAVSQSALSPIGRALKGFVGEFSYGLSNVIEFFAGILPWLIFVIMPGLWIMRRWWRGRKTPPKEKTATPSS
ncbi:MAG: DUF4349 domain-containing protein [Hellea sp.]